MRLGLKALNRTAVKEKSAAIRRALGHKSVVLIGLMGAGKTAIGRRLGNRLDIPFTDADTEIESAAGQSISEIFAKHGESYFRDGERKVIARLLGDGPQVLATGGGAYMNAFARKLIAKKSVSVWLKADLDVLLERVRRRNNRPLLKCENPQEVMQQLIDERYPIYAEADITIQSRDVTHETIVGEIVMALYAKLAPQRAPKAD